MKAQNILFYILIIILSFSSSISYAQKSKEKGVDKYFDESGGFVHRLWYGGNFNLGFGGSGNSSQFSFGLTPMVGYKVLPFLSFGPRIGFNYTNLRGQTDNGLIQTGVKSVNLWDYTFAAFTRIKFLNVLFAQAEYGVQSNQVAFTTNNNNIAFDSAKNKIITERQSQPSLFAGLGYNAGQGGIGYEILVLYNFKLPENSFNSPFDIRVGFTYKF